MDRKEELVIEIIREERRSPMTGCSQTKTPCPKVALAI
jgi:hypothetical protein